MTFISFFTKRRNQVNLPVEIIAGLRYTYIAVGWLLPTRKVQE